MKVAQLCAVDFTLYHFLLPLMKATRDAGHEVVGICGEGPLADKVRAEGIRVEAVRIDRSFNLFRHFGSYRALVRLFRRERFDIVHVHTPVASLVGRAAAWRARVPTVVYTAHGFYFHERMAWWKRRLFVTLEWLAGRKTDVLFTQAEEDAAFARRTRLIRGETIEAIGNGVDPGRFHTDEDGSVRRRIRAEFGTPADRVVIAMIGRLVAEKGYPELIEAMRAVDAELWIVGERLVSDHAAEIDQAVALADTDPILKSRVRFLGYRSDVPDILRAADIFTLPSHREGMPRSVIEAMMVALPVVGTDIRGTREEVLPGETGILVPVGDAAALAEALNRLVADEALRRRWGAAGRERALKLYDEKAVIARQLSRLGLDRAPAVCN